MVGVGGEIEVVYGDVAALAEVFEGDCSPDSCGAAGYCGGEGGEEVCLWHGCVSVLSFLLCEEVFN